MAEATDGLEADEAAEDTTLAGLAVWKLTSAEELSSLLMLLLPALMDTDVVCCCCCCGWWPTDGGV